MPDPKKPWEKDYTVENTESQEPKPWEKNYVSDTEKKNPVGTSTSTIPKENSELAPKTGSSASKGTNGFPEIDTNGILPDFDKMKSGSGVVDKPKTKLQKPPEKEETSFFDYLKENLDTGLATVSKSIYDTPGLIYDAAASITNPILKGVTGYKGEGASADKLAKDLGFRNIPSEILKEKIKVSNEKINEYASKNGGDALAALENGNYSGAAKLVAGTTVQSLPIMIAAMASGGETTALSAIGLSTASTKNAELKEEHPEMKLGTRVSNAAASGLLEAVTGHLFTGASGAVMKKILADKGVEAGSKIIAKSFKSTIEKAIEKNPLVGALGEVVEETAVEFGNQANDIASGIRAEFDIHAIKNAGLSATGMGGLQTLGVYGAKGYVKAKTYNQIKSVNKEVFKLQNELSNENISAENKNIIGGRIERLLTENKKLLGGELEKLNALPMETKKELNALNSDFEDIKSKIENINEDDSLSPDVRKSMLDELKVRAESAHKRKSEILSTNDNQVIEGDFSNFEGVEPDFDIEKESVNSLPMKEQETLKKQAMEALVTELNPDGKKNITITNEQVVERANEIYTESKKNETVDSRSSQSQDVSTEPTATNTEPTSVLSEESNKTQTSQPSSSEVATPSVNTKIEGNSPLSVSASQETGSEAAVNLPLKSKLSDEEKAKVQKKVVSKPRVILRSGKVGTDAFFALPNEGVFGDVVDKVGSDENVTAYRYPKDFKIKDLSNDVVFDEYMSKKMFEDTKKEGYDAAYVMEIDGSKVLHVINPEKLTLLDEKLPELRNNETVQRTNPPTDGNIRLGTEPMGENGATKQESTAEESVPKPDNVPTAKGEVTAKLQQINKKVFGLDDKKSKANTVVMEKTLETIAERTGKTKEEVFDSIHFEKGDAATAEKLSKKGKALFQIIGQNAKLSEQTKGFLEDAKTLEKQGAEAKTIFLQTGWEKGADGKWKYDMQEGTVEFKKTENGSLEDVLDYPELFDKYPEAKGIKIVFNGKMDMEGMFDASKNRIFINPSPGIKEAKVSLLHEIQHWVQKKEGFSKGGSTETAKAAISEKINTEKNPSIKKALNGLKNLLFAKKVNAEKVNSELTRLEKLISKDDFELYQSIAGEVEARNVEKRYEMTDNERRNTSLSETEDVGRDEQMVLFQGEQGAMLAKDGEFIIYALTDPNVSTPLHEMAHVYEHYLTEAERNTLLKEAGHTTWSRETSEHFARGFEKYLADGIAPSPEMKTIFDNFKKWLTEIYRGIQDSAIDIRLSPEMKAVYNEMLGEKSKKETTNKPIQYKASENGKPYNVVFENGELKITDENGKAPSAPTRRVIEAKHADNFDFTKGETALDKQKINDVSTWEEDVAAHSENPVEVAETLLRTYTMDASEGLDTQSKHIAEAIGGKGAERSSFVQRVGKKGMKDIPGSLAMQYFAPKGKGSGLDIIAQNAEIAMYGDWDSQNPRITEDDVLDFINDNPRGTVDYLNSAKKEKINALKTAFTHLTGLPANEKYLGKAIEQAKTKEEFLNNYATEVMYLSDEDLVSLQNESETSEKQHYGTTEETAKTNASGKTESSTTNSEESKKQPGVQSDSGPEDSGSQEQKNQTVEKTSAEQMLDWLDEMENNLDQFGKENLSVGIPIVVGKAAIQAMRVAVKSGMLIADVIQAGLDAVKQSDWYKNLSATEKSQAEKDFMDSFGNPKIDSPSDRQTENLLNRSLSDKISEEEAYEEVKSTFDKARTELNNKKSFKEYARDAYRNFVKRFTDRQYLAKSLLNKSGMKAVQNLIINAHGASGRAKIHFEEAYNEIYKKLTTEERQRLDEIIQTKRFIAIDENREARGLEPVSHPNFIDKNKSEKFLSKLEKELGTEKYNDLVKRAEAYFKTYKGLLAAMLDNGLISQASYDSLSDIDYQPRVFLQFVTDFNGDLETNKRANNIDTGGLSSEQIKSMSEGDANSLVLNSEWLLTNSLLSRSKAMAMNNINKRFMTGEFQKAQARFDKLDPKNLKGDDVRFYKYFKELSSKVIDNPVIGEKESGNPKFKYDKTPANFGKAYYYVDGQRHEFFLENDLHESWNDNFEGVIKSNYKEFISYASGAALVKAIATGNNPAFPIVNTPRDFLFTTAFSDQYSNIVPKAMVQIAKDVVKSIKEIRKPQSDVLKKYIEYGGAMDFLSSQGTLKKESLLGQAIDKSVSANTRDMAKSVFSKVTLHKISQYSEMMFRLGIFQRSIKNQLDALGFTVISEVTDRQQLEDIYSEAVASARSILDFNQGGVITKDLEAVIPYINVAFQGGRVAAAAFEKDPVGTTSRVLQLSTIASTIPIGISLALISAMKADDDDDKSTYEIYLHATDGISKYQKMKYMNIVTGVKNDEGEYQIIKIAKAQELSPVMSVTDDIYANFIRSMAGKPKKSPLNILDDAAFTFNSNVMPVDVTSPAGFFTRTPVVKATLSYLTGFDFFREEPLSMDIGKVPKAVEGITMSSTEDFYKKLGENYGLSPIRSKAFVESLITGPSTNPFVGMLYGGADAATSDKDMKQIGKELFETVYKSTGKRVVGYSSDFNRQLAKKEELQKEIDAINTEKYKQKAEFNKLAKQYTNKEITKAELDSKIDELDPKDKGRFYNKLQDKVRLKGVDGTIIDIKYEQEAAAKALMIMHYYGDVFDGSKDSKEILRQMNRAKGVLTPATMVEYNKLKNELNKKTPN